MPTQTQRQKKLAKIQKYRKIRICECTIKKWIECFFNAAFFGYSKVQEIKINCNYFSVIPLPVYSASAKSPKEYQKVGNFLHFANPENENCQNVLRWKARGKLASVRDWLDGKMRIKLIKMKFIKSALRAVQ